MVSQAAFLLRQTKIAPELSRTSLSRLRDIRNTIEEATSEQRHTRENKPKTGLSRSTILQHYMLGLKNSRLIEFIIVNNSLSISFEQPYNDNTYSFIPLTCVGSFLSLGQFSTNLSVWNADDYSLVRNYLWQQVC